MRLTHIALAMTLALGRGVAGAGSGEWIEAQSLRELPAGIQVLLGVGLAPEGGIADRGERFNALDAIAAGGDDKLPRRRFALGIVGTNTALVAEERGGIGYSVRAVEYRRTGATWDAARCAALFAPPRSAAELLEAFAERRSMPCSRFDSASSAPQTGGARPRPGA